MPSGIQIFGPGAGLELEISDRVYRLLTITTIPTTDSGSINIPGLAGGSAVIGAVQFNEAKQKPALSVSGTNLNWNYAGVPSGKRDSQLTLMVAAY